MHCITMTHRVPRHKASQKGGRQAAAPAGGGQTCLLVTGALSAAESDQLVLAQLRLLEPDWAPTHLDHPDIARLNPDTALSISLVRDLQSQLGYRPLQRQQRYIIIYRLDQASLPAQHALLKSLEEPPAYVTIIATTAQLDKLLETIRSRCLVQRGRSGQLSSFSGDAADDQSEWSYTRLAQTRLAELIAQADQVSDRAVALNKLEQAIKSWHQDQAARDRLSPSQYAQAMELLHDCWSGAGANANVKLAVTDCLVRVKALLDRADAG
ncbi:MAG: hypothetical protein COU69_00885 [Candidatus Pacebacteria bacterium CG10_big_fil_rev_8_21_14_0_10_56_10]|nr:MAG: hypothetical protein COU69_00885 [Candidatus Pacebacteria bacterium CG10_big_fil_rev_8_21_14_0_10_56_10]